MLPSIPPEIWLQILALAVHVPGLFDTKWDQDLLEERIWEGGFAAESVAVPDESRRTRLAITQVSHEWRGLGRQLMYEYIRVDMSDSDRVNVTTTFIQPGMEPSLPADERADIESNPALSTFGDLHPRDSWWTKRLDISGHRLEEGNLPTLLRLIDACPNVKILILTFHAYDALFLPRLSPVLQRRSAHSLRRMSVRKWSPSSSDTDANETMNLWKTLPNVPIDSLALIVDWTSPLSSDDILPQSMISTLSSLELDIGLETRHLQVLPPIVFPALKYLHISRVFKKQIPSLVPFMAINGQRLLGLGLRTRPRCENLHLLLQYTTTLRSLVIRDTDIASFSSNEFSTYPSVTHIGVTGVDYVSFWDSKRIHDGLMFGFPRKTFPNLRTVRILERNIPESIDPNWSRSITRAVTCGIRLEDAERRLLEVRAGEPLHGLDF